MNSVQPSFNYVDFLTKGLVPKDYASMTEEQLLDELKNIPDFSKLPLPTTWYKKFPDLPKSDCMDTKQYLKESPWKRKAYVLYEGSGKVQDIPAQPGGVRPVLPAPEIPTLTLLQNSFSDAPTGQSADEHPQDYPEMKVNSIESTETKSQE
jgi:hypothetical protein